MPRQAIGSAVTPELRIHRLPPNERNIWIDGAAKINRALHVRTVERRDGKKGFVVLEITFQRDDAAL